jgi:hypothetical protein
LLVLLEGETMTTEKYNQQTTTLIYADEMPETDLKQFMCVECGETGTAEDETMCIECGFCNRHCECNKPYAMRQNFNYVE